MPNHQQTLLCRYHYDPLDRLADCTPSSQARTQRFYLKERLTSEIQGSIQRSIFQQDDHLLAQQQRQDSIVETTLLAADRQRSVLQALDATGTHPLVYTPYGHRVMENGLLSLLGFNGERLDPMTGYYLLGNGYRAFNPVLMRFNSPDSFSPFREGGFNAYVYCVGDPVNKQDPTGHVSWAALMLKHFPKAMSAVKTMNVASKPNQIIGPFNKFLGMPHILENILGNVESKTLVNLSLISKDMNRLVKSHVRPIANGPADKIPAFLHHELRSIATGRSKGHLPSQVLGNETLVTFAKRAQRGANPMTELTETMALNAHLKAKSLVSRPPLKRASESFSQQTQSKKIRKDTTV
ncbi:RHS repeat-associated core domain-containing protein [Pseudomonas citrulli]|uniref:RHS repeat-associated core domain-containing protein n=1 Tax=Pseudomonas citrulli TaxID=3064347 RepID=A0ABT9BV52_9PSED|nr:RHS repeat-associated core domain-containing protein [Pseudomonas sp. K18]MDO7896436.1 RHS repeat-associated core domain-containing protein [Pseudomonas sp. K18]